MSSVGSVGQAERVDGSVVLRLSGHLDRELAQTLDERLRDFARSQERRIALSCKALQSFDSELAGVLLSHLVQLKNQGGDIVLFEVPEPLQRQLAGLGLQKLLKTYASQDAALASFQAGARVPSDDPNPELSMSREELGAGRVLLRVHGAIERQTLEALDRRLAAIDGEGARWLIIDGAGLSYLTSSAVGVFIALQPRFAARGGGILFFALNDVVRTVITTLGLHRLFPLHDDRASALASLPAEDA